MILKILGSALVVTSAMLYASLLEQKNQKRLHFLEEFYAFLEEIRTQIVKYPISIEEFLQKKILSAKSVLTPYLKIIQQKMRTNTFEHAWQKGFAHCAKENELKEEDLLHLDNAKQALLYDRTEVIDANLSICETALQKHLTTLQETFRQQKALNKKLFPLLALGVIIMLL